MLAPAQRNAASMCECLTLIVCLAERSCRLRSASHKRTTFMWEFLTPHDAGTCCFGAHRKVHCGSRK